MCAARLESRKTGNCSARMGREVGVIIEVKAVLMAEQAMRGGAHVGGRWRGDNTQPVER